MKQDYQHGIYLTEILDNNEVIPLNMEQCITIESEESFKVYTDHENDIQNINKQNMHIPENHLIVKCKELNSDSISNHDLENYYHKIE